MTNIEKRLFNTERALVSLWSLLEPTCGEVTKKAIDLMISDYFDAQVSLGVEFNGDFMRGEV